MPEGAGAPAGPGRILLATLIAAVAAWGSTREPARQAAVYFEDVSEVSGVAFDHENGATPEKYMPETMSGGAVIFDYDNDGWQDLIFVNSGSFVAEAIAASARHTLLHNDGDGTFSDVSDTAGIGVSGFGMGACAADYDNDGWVDLYLTSVNRNALYRNLGSGEFADVTEEARVGTDLWSASCAFGDIDNDGDVDLYVTNYVDFDPIDNHQFCGGASRERVYCHPNVYNGLPDVLYRNEGDGTFTDVSEASGIFSPDGKGLGVVFGDYDDDGWVDIYVANDSVRNFLFHNEGDGTFVESALFAGVAYGADGQPLAGMGTDMGDVDGDGLPDFFVTNLSMQTHNLYRNMGRGLFDEVTTRSGVAVATRPFVGFGTAFLDYDNDADLDLAIANGDVIDNVALIYPDRTFPQRNLLLANDGKGAFVDLGLAAGPGFQLEKVSRALAIGDLDNDGDLDIVIANNGQRADLLRNEGGNRSGNAVLIRLAGTRSHPDGIGARLRVILEQDGEEQILVREIRAGSSYLAQNDLRAHFGLGAAERVRRVEVNWPSGIVDVLEDVDANQILTIVEGGGLESTAPFAGGAR